MATLDLTSQSDNLSASRSSPPSSTSPQTTFPSLISLSTSHPSDPHCSFTAQRQPRPPAPLTSLISLDFFIQIPVHCAPILPQIRLQLATVALIFEVQRSARSEARKEEARKQELEDKAQQSFVKERGLMKAST
ncbi:uncharacterized protein [Pyrus communis]|uniref:uncharacterized protein n=1 Tax=Pyrus communis TaxID=23211 RepID=UPI0035C1BE83